MAPLHDDVLGEILQRVSQDTGECSHALVCRAWRRVTDQAQVRFSLLSIHVWTHSGALRLVTRFVNLKVLELHPDAFGRHNVTDSFMRSLALAAPKLQHFTLHQSEAPQPTREYQCAAYTSAGLHALVTKCPGLRSLALRHGHPSHPFFLPDSVTGLCQLSVLELYTKEGSNDPVAPGFWGLTSLHPSLGALASLRVLKLHGYFLRFLPVSLGELQGLRELSLSCPSLEKLPSSFGGLFRLEKLSIFSRELSYLPGSFWDLKRLWALDLDCVLLWLTAPEQALMRELMVLVSKNKAMRRLGGGIQHSQLM